MKILEITWEKVEIIKTDEEEFPLYRRTSSGKWEIRMGAAWERCVGGEAQELEIAYLAYKRAIRQAVESS